MDRASSRTVPAGHRPARRTLHYEDALRLRRHRRRDGPDTCVRIWLKRSSLACAGVPEYTLTTDDFGGPREVSDTESPVSLMSAITGVRHQLSRLGERSRMAPQLDAQAPREWLGPHAKMSAAMPAGITGSWAP